MMQSSDTTSAQVIEERDPSTSAASAKTKNFAGLQLYRGASIVDVGDCTTRPKSAAVHSPTATLDISGKLHANCGCKENITVYETMTAIEMNSTARHTMCNRWHTWPFRH